MDQNTIGDETLAAIRMGRHGVNRLVARGVISGEARDMALALIEPPRRWGLWAGRLMGAVGVALILAGLVYFFAFNWNQIPPLAKLGALAALIMACCLALAAVGFGRWMSDAMAASAVVLVGVFLAVEGQTYQTGADAWTLFAAWAGLTLLWALLANSAATWAVWIGVAAVTVFTWWDQVQPADAAYHTGRNLSLMALFGLPLAAREWLAEKGFDWVAARWTRFYLGVPFLLAAGQIAVLLLDTWRGFGPVEVAAFALVPLVLLAMGIVYRHRLPDTAMLAAVVLTACAVVDFALFRLLAGGARHADLGTFFMMGLLTLALFAAAVAWLRAVARKMEGQG